MTVQRTADDVAAAAAEAAVRVTRVMWCGNDGLVRAKGVATAHLRERMAGGVGLTRAQPAQTARDRIAPVPGRAPVGEMRLLPDPTTFRVLPYAPRTAAVLADWVDLDGAPEPTCPRGVLRRALAALQARGLSLHAGFEVEYALAREQAGAWEPIDRSPCFSAIGAAAAQEHTDALLGALEEQGIGVEGCHAEGGPGQNEVALAPGPGLRAADEQVLVRETVRGVARAQGLVASLAPKPYPDGAGNGLHVHVSLRGPDGANALAAPDGLSPTGRAFVAGLLDHLPALCALTAPSAGSYLRLVPCAWAGAWACWGPDNREAAVRDCSPRAGAERESRNVEYKPCDASASPYLALGAIAAAGLDGIARGLEPPPPVAVDPATLSQDERDARGIAPLPRTPAEALDALDSDPVLMAALGPELAACYLAVRRAEWEHDRGAGPAELCADGFLRY